MAIENYGRVYRLLKAKVPVNIEIHVDVSFTGDREHGVDTIAEILGTDPKIKDELVMLGGHLDSWASATGATDNGAGTVVAMEVMRILNTLQVKPRRTIRVALWTGEEQGEFGSYGYVKQHFGYVPRSTEPDQLKLTEYDRKAAGPLQLKPDQQKISGYFNVDNGSGKIRGVYLQQNAGVAPIFAQWIEPLKDLGVTTLSTRNTVAPTMRLLMLWASLGSSSFRIRSITERAHTIQIWILTSVCSRRTWQRRHWWRRYSFITLQCETRCCRENRYRIPSWSHCVARH